MWVVVGLRFHCNLTGSAEAEEGGGGSCPQHSVVEAGRVREPYLLEFAEDCWCDRETGVYLMSSSCCLNLDAF